jgi:hypothetical protein
MVKGILSLTLTLNFKISSPSGIAEHDLLFVQFADSAGKIAVGALKQIPFPFILSELFFIVHEYA